MKQLIAITGGTGFIGQAICRQLLTQDCSLRVLVRDRRKLPLDLQAAELVQGDLADRDSLQQLVEGVDAVIHCAGNVRGATQSAFDRVNVDGSRNLLHAVKATGTTTTRLLSISSLAAREPQLSYYAASKRRAEQLLMNEGDGITWTILRPPAVYGPGDRELLPLFRLMARGIAVTAGSPLARFSMIYVEDLVSATLAWLQGSAGKEKIYTLDDGQVNGYDWHDISRIVGEICDRKVRVVQASPWLFDLPAWINSRFASLSGRAPMLTPQKLRELRHHDWVCNSADFQRDVDWHPQFLLADGLKATPGWPGHHPEQATP